MKIITNLFLQDWGFCHPNCETKNKDKVYPETLRKIKLTILDDETCSKYWKFRAGFYNKNEDVGLDYSYDDYEDEDIEDDENNEDNEDDDDEEYDEDDKDDFDDGDDGFDALQGSMDFPLKLK